MDFSCIPLWFGGLNWHIDDRLAKQQLYHLLNHVAVSENVSKALKDALLTDKLIDIANSSHVVSERGYNKIERRI